MVVHSPFAQEIFSTVSLGLLDWVVVFAIGFSIVIFSEIIKLSVKAEVKEQSKLRGKDMSVE